MQVRKIGWIVGSLGLLVGAGTAWADDSDDGNDDGEHAGHDSGSSAGGKECRDAGVTVAFKTGSAELDLNARGALDGVATWMKADDSRTMHLEGFADTTGDSAANLVLSAKRAEAVKNYLMEKGVDQTKVMTVGRGEEIDHLPANGRAVTFLACRGKAAMAEAEPGSAGCGAGAARAGTGSGAGGQRPAGGGLPPAAPAPRWQRGFGWALMAGGGYQDFTKDTMRDVTAGGGYWDARFIGGTNSIIGFEAAYIGSARSINTWAPRPTTRRWCRTASRVTSESTPRCGEARTCSSRTDTRASATRTSTSRTTTRTPATCRASTRTTAS